MKLETKSILSSFQYIEIKEERSWMTPNFQLKSVDDNDTYACNHSFNKHLINNYCRRCWIQTWSYLCCGNNYFILGSVYESSQIFWALASLGLLAFCSVSAATMSDLVKSLVVWLSKADQPHIHSLLPSLLDSRAEHLAFWVAIKEYG